MTLDSAVRRINCIKLFTRRSMALDSAVRSNHAQILAGIRKLFLLPSQHYEQIVIDFNFKNRNVYIVEYVYCFSCLASSVFKNISI